MAGRKTRPPAVETARPARIRRSVDEVAKEGQTVTISAAFPPDVASQLFAIRDDTRRSMSGIIVDLVRTGLEMSVVPGRITDHTVIVRHVAPIETSPAAAEKVAEEIQIPPGLSDEDVAAIRKLQQGLASGEVVVSTAPVQPASLPTPTIDFGARDE